MILHESAHRPAGVEFEYMAGYLRDALQRREFGHALTDTGYERARNVAEQLRDVDIQEIVTDEFPTPLETARLISEGGLDSGILTFQISDFYPALSDEAKRHLKDKERIVTDTRIAESDLSYLTRERFAELTALGEPFIFTRDWYAQASQEEKAALYGGHVEVWNESIERNDGKALAFVLHVEGMQFFVNELLERDQDEMLDLHFRRGSYVHAQVFPDRQAVVSF